MTPRIDALDLRSPEALAVVAADRRLDWAPDFPPFPERVRRFIAGEPMATHSARAFAWPALASPIPTLDEPSTRDWRRWRWPRILLWASVVCAEAACAYALVWTWA